MPLDYNEFAEKIKQQNPEYSNVDNYTLAMQMVEKYPQYKSKVDLKKKEVSQSTLDQDNTSSDRLSKTTTPKPTVSSSLKGEGVYTIPGQAEGVFFKKQADGWYKKQYGVFDYKKVTDPNRIKKIEANTVEYNPKPKTKNVNTYSFEKTPSVQEKPQEWVDNKGNKGPSERDSIEYWDNLLANKNIDQKTYDFHADRLASMGIYKSVSKALQPKVQPKPSEVEAQKVFKESFDSLSDTDPEYLRRKAQQEKINASIKGIDSSLVGLDEGDVVPKINEAIKGYDYLEVKESGMGYDEVLIRNKVTGESRRVNLDNWTTGRDNEEAKILRGWLEAQMYSKEYTDAFKKVNYLRDQIQNATPTEKITLTEQLLDAQSALNKEKVKREAYVRGDKYLSSAIYDKNAQENVKVDLARTQLRTEEFIDKSKDYKDWSDKIQEAYNKGEISQEDYYQNYLPKLKAEKDALFIEQQNIKDDYLKIKSDQTSIDEIAADNFLIEENRGNVLTGAASSFLRGVESSTRFILEGMSEEAGGAKEGSLKGVFQQLAPGSVSELYTNSANRSTFEKIVFGLSESGGSAMAGLATGGPSATLMGLYAASYTNMKDQMNTAAFKDVPEWQKILMSSVYGGTVGMLEEIGIGKWFTKTPAGKGLTNWILKQVLTELPENATAEAIEMAIKQSTKAAIANGLIQVSSTGLVEGSTELAQEAADMVYKDIFNTLNDKKFFDNPNTWEGVFSRLGENFILGFAGGAGMQSITQTTQVAKNAITMNQLNNIESLISNPNIKDIFKMNLKDQIMSGEITSKQAKEQLQKLDDLEATVNKIPKEVKAENKYQAFKLLNERDEIQKEIAGKDPSLVAAQTERINAINEELKTISKNAVQERSTEEVLPREPETTGEAGGQREGMGQGVQGEIITEEGPITQEEKVAPKAEIGGIIRGYESISEQDNVGDVRSQLPNQNQGIAVVEGKDGNQYAVAFSRKGGDGKNIFEQGVTTPRPGYISASVKIEENATPEQVQAAQQEAQRNLDVILPTVVGGAINAQTINDVMAQQAPVVAPVVQAETGKEFGYRSGDLTNKAETREKFEGGDRSTGHFGTGFYFFGAKDKANQYDDRETSPIDLSGYNLAKGTIKLHDLLKDINNFSIGKNRNNERLSNRIELLLNNLGKSEILPINRNSSDQEFEAYRKSVANQNDKIKSIISEINKSTVDSPSTVVMKALGFDGIDSRGTELDNAQYGSVIYSLKEEANQPSGKTGQLPTVEADQVAVYRAEEQAELLKAIPKIESYKVNGEIDKTLMPKTVLAKYNKIYNKYDKLISPLLNLVNNQKETKFAQDETGKIQPERTGDGRGRTESRRITPLEGAPSVPGINGPDPQIVGVAEKYAADNGIDLKRQAEYVELDEERAKRLADAYEQMADDPQNPKVKEAYQDLVNQTIAQYQALVDAGYKFWFMDFSLPSNEEYASTPYNALRDLRQNKEMGIFATIDGYGEDGITQEQIEANPMLADTGLMWPIGGIDGKMMPVLVNDLFRAVHDAFGHGLEGAGFRARGEENAWQAHVRLFTGPAIGAITSETRGQNSWVNFGPEAEFNRTASGADTKYATQKVGLMPEWTWTEGRAGDMEADILEVDTKDETNLQKVLNFLDKADKDLGKFGRETLGINIPVATMRAIIKAAKVLVKTGITLQEAIIQAAEKKNVSKQDALNAIKFMSETINQAPKKVVVNEPTALKDQIRLEARAAREGAKSVSEAVKAITTFFKEKSNQANLTRANLKSIINIISSVKDQKTLDTAADKIYNIISSAKSEIIEVNEAAALRDQLRLESRAAREAKTDLNTKRKQIATFIRSLETKGTITARQAAALVKRVSSLNLDNETMVERFEQYAEKVFQRAEYQDLLTKAFRTRRLIRKAIKSENQAEVVGMAKLFSKIDPSLVDDIDNYISLAENVLNAVRPSKQAVQDPALRQAVNIEAVAEYANEEIAKQEENRKRELMSEYKYLVDSGAITEDLSVKEMKEIISIITDPTAEFDPEADKKKLSFLKIRLASMEAVFKYMLSNNINPFTGEDVVINPKDADLIKRVLKMDLNEMSVKDAAKVVEAMDNFLMNDITSGLEAAVRSYEGAQNAKQLVDQGKKARTLKSYFNKTVGRIFGEQFISLPLLFEKMFPGIKNAANVMQKMGLVDVINGSNKAIRQHNDLMTEYSKQDFYKQKGFMEAKNVYERGMLAFLKRNLIGNKTDIRDEFKRRSEIIKQSIESLRENGTDKEIQMADLYQDIYDKLDVAKLDLDVIEANADKMNKDAVAWMINEWGKHYGDLADISLSVYNSMLGSDTNYTPDRYKSLSAEDQGLDEALLNSGSGFMMSMDYTDKNKTGVLMEATRPKVLPKGRYISLDFDVNNFNSIKGALVDINTAAAIRQIDGFTKSKAFNKLIPEAKDRKILTKRINTYIQKAKGKRTVTSDTIKDVERLANFVTGLGVGKALAGFDQPIKQTVPVIINTFINSNGNMKFVNADMNEAINRSGMPIANRGLESRTAVESIDRLLEKTGGIGAEVIKKIEDVNQFWLKTLLAKPDVWVARSSFITYYLKDMKSKGENVKDIDWSKHEWNKDSAEYAQLMVDRQQNISDDKLAGDFLSSDDPTKRIARKVIMPFATFIMNQKARMHNDLLALRSKDTSIQDRKSALKSLAGLAAELVSYQLIAYGIKTLVYDSIANALAGDDEEEKKDKSFFGLKMTTKQFNATKFPVKSIVGDILSPLPFFDDIVTMGFDKTMEYFPQISNEDINKAVEEKNSILRLKGENEMDANARAKFIEQLKSDNIYSVSFKNDSQSGRAYGMIGIAYDTYKEMIDLSDMAYSGEFEDEYQGRVIKKYLPEEDRKILQNISVPLMILYSTGIAPKDLGTVARKVTNIVKKKGITENQHEKEKEVKKQINRDLSKWEFELVKTRKKSDGVVNEINFVERNGGLTDKQGLEYVKLLDVMPEPTTDMLRDIQNGKTVDQIIKKSKG